MINHLALYNRKLFKQDYLGMILDGTKPVDIKLSIKRIAPYMKMSIGDQIFLKESSGPVVGMVTTTKVEYYDFHETSNLLEVLSDIKDPVGLESEQHLQRMWEYTKHKRYGTVFWFNEPVIFANPVYIEKYDRRTWIADWQLPFEIRMTIGEA